MVPPASGSANSHAPSHRPRIQKTKFGNSKKEMLFDLVFAVLIFERSLDVFAQVQIFSRGGSSEHLYEFLRQPVGNAFQL
jgi:hypothetical protein